MEKGPQSGKPILQRLMVKKADVLKSALKLLKKNKSGCLEWHGRTFKSYGQIYLKGIGFVRVHRLMWELEKGSIPKGKLVCHTCDNRRCANTKHLFLGTPQENMTDMVQKNRAMNGWKSSGAKLTDKEVKEILTVRRLNPGRFWGAKELAQKHGVTKHTIFNIVKGRSWRYIERN